MSELKESLKRGFRDAEYRYGYAESFLNTVVAAQIKALREQRRMSQADVAKEIGTKQPGIARLENVNYSAWKTETLRRLARAFGVRLKITFEEFGGLPDEVEGFKRGSLERRSFEEDPVFNDVPSQESLDAEAERGTARLPARLLNYTTLGGPLRTGTPTRSSTGDDLPVSVVEIATYVEQKSFSSTGTDADLDICLETVTAYGGVNQ